MPDLPANSARLHAFPGPDKVPRGMCLTPNFRAARLQRPIILNAKAFIPFHTPVLGSGDMAGIILADTIDYYLIGVVALERFADLRDHGVWLMKRRERHSLCRRCNG